MAVGCYLELNRGNPVTHLTPLFLSVLRAPGCAFGSLFSAAKVVPVTEELS